MSEAMQYIHLYVLSSDTIAQRIDGALRSYRDDQNEPPERIELGHEGQRALTEFGGGMRFVVWRDVPIRYVESPHYLAVVGERLTVRGYSMLGFEPTMRPE